MHIRSESNVVGQVPALVIRIVIDDHIVRIPQPAVAEANVIGRHAEVEAAEPEASRSAAGQPPAMIRPKAARKMPMLKRMVQVIVRIVLARVVAYPVIVAALL